jgi:hypothetical protein
MTILQSFSFDLRHSVTRLAFRSLTPALPNFVPHALVRASQRNTHEFR